MKKQSPAPKKIEIDEAQLRALVAAVVDERLRALRGGEPAARDEREYGDYGDYGDYGVEWVAC